MPVKFRDSGPGLTVAQLAAGVKIADIPGDGCVGPFIFVLFLFADAGSFAPNDPSAQINILAPANPIVSNLGAEADGGISVSLTWVNTGNDDHNWGQAGGGSGAFNFWSDVLIRGNAGTGSLPAPPPPTFEIVIQMSPWDYDNFNPTSSNPTSNPNPTNPNWDGDKGSVVLNWNIDDVSESPTSTVIVRDDVPIMSLPITGVGPYSITDTVFAPGTYHYKFGVYKLSDSTKSPLLDGFDVTFGGPPTFEITASGGFDMGGSAIFGFLVNPSGLYKLTVGKTHDTLYTDVTTDNNTVDLAIP